MAFGLRVERMAYTPPPAILFDPARSGPCELTYARFHLLWTIPALLVLLLLSRPFLTRLDHAKLAFLPAIALIWTTAWDSQLIRRGAWTYPRQCVLATVWFVPVEEYFFIAIQSVIITLFTSLATRWILLPKYLAGTRPGSLLSNPVTWSTVLLSGVFWIGVWLTWYDEHTYYLGMILWWAAVPLALLQWGTSDFILRLLQSRNNLLLLLTPILAPTLYLWHSDVFAMRRKTWHITARTSLGFFFPMEDLPVEEALFFLVTNLILISASLTFDRVVAKAWFEGRSAAGSVQPPLSTSYLPLWQWSTIQSLWSHFVSSDAPSLRSKELPSSTTSLMKSIEVLERASRSFAAASYLLPWDLRVDLCSLYAFCRASDDLIDEAAHSCQVKRQRLKGLYAMLDVAYNEKGDAAAVEADVLALAGDVADTTVFRDLHSVARTLCDFRHIIPRSLWEQLLDAYAMDVRLEEEASQAGGKGIGYLATREELETYAQGVAGAVGEMCTRVILHRSGYLHAQAATEEKRWAPVIAAARRMGVALQYVNIARDAADDFTVLKRCYIPRSMLGDDLIAQIESISEGKEGEGTAPTPGELLRPLALELAGIARAEYDAAFPAIAKIPIASARSGFRVACAVYTDIASVIRAQSPDEIRSGKRAAASGKRRIWVALKTLYFS